MNAKDRQIFENKRKSKYEFEECSAYIDEFWFGIYIRMIDNAKWYYVIRKFMQLHVFYDVCVSNVQGL